ALKVRPCQACASRARPTCRWTSSWSSVSSTSPGRIPSKEVTWRRCSAGTAKPTRFGRLLARRTLRSGRRSASGPSAKTGRARSRSSSWSRRIPATIPYAPGRRSGATGERFAGPADGRLAADRRADLRRRKLGVAAPARRGVVTAVGAATRRLAAADLDPGSRRLLVLVRLDHPVDQPVLARLFRLEEFVAFHVEVDLVERLAGVFDIDVVEAGGGRGR